jgi:transcriptional regulator PpsR
VKAFKTPRLSLGNLDAESAATIVAAAADVSLIVDEAGVIRDVAFQSDELEGELSGYERWLGMPLADTVTQDSKPKVDRLLREASRDVPKWRHLNHMAIGGGSVPVLYSAVRIGTTGNVVAFGRDLRALSALQQRLVDAQQSMEREYGRLRNVEMRYRLLFQTSPESVLIVDAASQRIVDANPAARDRLSEAARRVPGGPLSAIFEPDSAREVQSLLAVVRAAGRSDEVRATLADGRDAVVSVSLFREDAALLFLVRLGFGRTEPAAAHAAEPATSAADASLLKLVESGPDGFVVSTGDGRILHANAAFLEMVQLATPEQARGEPLERWIGRPGVDLDVLIANLRQRGAVRMFNTSLHGEHGAKAEVEISAVSVMNGTQPCFGFAIRDIGARFSVAPKESATRAGRDLPRSVEHLSELIGRVALKDLVREATDVIERLAIEAALELSNDNRASAAEMLGLSRQSLYVKLRRYGLGDLATEGGA